MNQFLLIFSLLFVTSAYASTKISQDYFEIQSIETTLESVQVNLSNRQGLSPNCSDSANKLKVQDEQEEPPAVDPEPEPPAVGKAEFVVDQIINIGKKIWKIIEAGKPVMNIQTDVATALPKGATCWQDLERWQAPVSKVYRTVAKNKLGGTVANFQFRILYIYGGSVKGIGKYIGYASMIPVNASVSWGYKLNAQGSVPAVFNLGTKENPLAGMQLVMSYRLESPLKTIEQSQAFFLNGHGQLKQLD